MDWDKRLENFKQRSNDLSAQFSRSQIYITTENSHEMGLIPLVATTPMEATATRPEVIHHAESVPFKEAAQRIENIKRRWNNNKLKSKEILDNLLKSGKSLNHNQQLCTEKVITGHDSSNVILTISVYSTHRTGMKSQIFEIHVTEKLTTLRDLIECGVERAVSLSVTHGDVPPPTLAQLEKYKNILSNTLPCFPSSYFLIEGRFYSDMRSSSAQDLSSTVRNWIEECAERKSIFGMDTEKYYLMEDTCWRDISIKVGKIYSFVHMGRCEHQFVIEKISQDHQYEVCKSHRLFSLISPSAPPPKSREIYRLKRRRRKCSICEINYTAWITCDDRLALENPCSFCEGCFRDLHYNAKGTLLYSDFRLYSFTFELI